MNSIQRFFLERKLFKAMKTPATFLDYPKVCKWYYCLNTQYITSCDASWDLMNQGKEAYKFCPNCGRKVVIS